MNQRQIEYVSITKPKPHPRNVRTHPTKQIGRIETSIASFGFINPIIVDENYVILAGHARFEAAKRAGLHVVPVIVVPGLSDAKKRTYLLGDNKLAEQAGWDRSALAIELDTLAPLLAEANIDFALTGFEPAEVDSLLNDHVDAEPDPADEIPEVEKKPISKRGDIWILGLHRLKCGDACDTADVADLMGNDLAVMVITDPPYNVKVSSIQGKGKIKHREFVQGSGEMSGAQFTRFLRLPLTLSAKHSRSGSIHFVFMDWRHMREMLDAGESVYSELKNLIVWVKSTPGMGTFYRSQHELIFVFKNGDDAHLNNFELGQHGRNRSNVWNYAGANTFRTDRMRELAMHPTVKPIALVTDAMRDCSQRGDIVLDPFVGSGTTIMAAEKVGRRGYGLEIDPLYVDVAVRRWQAFTKRDAILAGTNQTFDEAAAARAKDGSKP